jgi:hypothetical protein
VSTTSVDNETPASVSVADGPLGAAAPAAAATGAGGGAGAMAPPVVHGADAIVASVSTLRSPPRPGSGTMEVVRLQRMRSMSQESLPDGVVDDVSLAIDDDFFDPFALLDVPVATLLAVVSSAVAFRGQRCDQREQEQQDGRRG